MAKTTPMMEQYLNIKDKHKNCILFFRLGDFYEMFYDDALIASKELEIALTGKSCGQEERAPMCGVPYHSVDNYISRLIDKGYKVAICDQMEDAKMAQGIVKRDVIRIVTPGTVLDTNVLDETKNNYLMCIYGEKTGYALAICDVTTGEFQTTEFPSIDAGEKLIDEIAKFNPAELICNEEFLKSSLKNEIESKFRLKLAAVDGWTFQYHNAEKKLCDHFRVHNVEGFGLRSNRFSICACGALMQYLYDTQKNDLNHIISIKNYISSDFMVLDIASRRNLELTQTMREKGKKGSLLWTLDQTKTSMGARLLRKWIEQPLVQKLEIEKRHDAVEELKNEIFVREEIKNVLRSMNDFERIVGKIIFQTVNCRDLISLKNSLVNLPLLKEVVRKLRSPYLHELYENLDPLLDITELIERSITDEPPFSVREGGMLKFGYHNELDILLNAKSEGTSWILNLEQEEKEKTNIKNLKIRYNKVFGYYIEVTKSNVNDVPERYIRKQTLTNCERYVTPELDNLAELILGAEEKIVDMEYQLFCEIRNKIANEVQRIQNCANLVSIIDVLQSFSEVAQKNDYIRPQINEEGILSIKEGRHPVVEKMMDQSFVPNDTFLDTEDNRLAIITGPNMAGKSTYMRQVALITLLAQIGSFIPAKEANISICDRIFTRVGASDDLSNGQSTFMVEMTEVANILHNATNQSLLILDEIGRGTSTFDGLSIAWAVLEYITDKKLIGAKTLFATHYHELTELEGKLNGVKNYCIAVKEEGEDIIFLRKINRGGADHSYGVQVARLAGLPQKVIYRSHEILKQLNAADITKKAKKLAQESKQQSEEIAKQMDIFTAQETQIADEIKKINIMELSPIEAWEKLSFLQKKVKGL